MPTYLKKQLVYRKKSLVIFLLFSIFTFQVSAQDAQDGWIHFDKRSNRPFIINNQAFSFKERKTIFKNKDALKLANSANGNYIGSQIMAGIGGGLLGITLSDIILAKRDRFNEEQWKNKKNARLAFAGAGAAFIAFAIPISTGGVKKIERAVEMENQANTEKKSTPSTALRIEGGFNSIAFKLTF